MIFNVSCDDFDDCHDEIVVASADFIGRRPSCAHYLQGEGASCLPQRRQVLRVIDLIVIGHEKTSRFEGDESASYVALADVTVGILSSIQMRFGLVSKR